MILTQLCLFVGLCLYSKTSLNQIKSNVHDVNSADEFPDLKLNVLFHLKTSPGAAGEAELGRMTSDTWSLLSRSDLTRRRQTSELFVQRVLILWMEFGLDPELRGLC